MSITSTFDTNSLDEVERALRDLPFVNDLSNKGTPYWDIDPVGDPDADLNLGLLCGALALGAAREFDSAVTIAVIMRDMMKGGRFGPVEAGFIAAVASAAKVGAHH